MANPRRLLVGTTFLMLASAASAGAADALRAGFASPPDSAKPQTWWHWMNGNVTKAGITDDLQAMRDIGLGGATIVNVDCGIPHGAVDFMGPQWRDDFKFAVAEADRLGLKLTVENCAGWSSSGGPWNTPANGMQRLTSSETRAQGPTPFDAVLPQPPTTLKFYRDVAVLAFRAPATRTATLASPATAPATLQVRQAVYEPLDGGPFADVTARINAMLREGKTSVRATSEALGGDPAFGQLKRLRVTFSLGGKVDTISVDERGTFIFPVNAVQLAKARAAAKTAVDRTFVHPPTVDPDDVGETVPTDGVLDLSSKMTPDGRLRWDVPPGNWVILRVGHTPIGVKNHPAPPEGTGLECDKLSAAALDAHWDGFMQKVLDDVGPLAGQSLEASLIDSYEVGGQDWTAAFRQEFQKRRGYDPVPYLPAYARRTVGSAAITERFLWDVRRTVADLFADNYFGHFNELCHRHGLNSAVEPYTGPFESLQSGKSGDVVMGEFWVGSNGHPSVKLAASIAHIYGKTIVGAESFTADGPASRWQNDPYSLKTLGDLMFCQGLNRYVFHRYAMQPWTDRKPGMTMGPWGLNFERTETWWDQGKGWIRYIARCEYLLQQGRAVADVAYFNGESAPSEMRQGNPPLPPGYDYDAVDADVLLHGATVDAGRIKLSSGASYAALVLPPGDVNLTPDVLACISKLVHDGATVVGARPRRSPSLADYPKCDARVAELAADLWGDSDGRTIHEHAVGQGRIVWGEPLADVLGAQHLKPDFGFTSVTPNAKLASAHRASAGDDIYFVSNQQQQFATADCTFRVTGKTPELWHPDTGATGPAPVWSAADGRTTVRLTLDPAGSMFVVFRPSTTPADHVVSATSTFSPDTVRVPVLTIGHAVYAATDGAGELDVTARLAGLVHDNQLAVEVTNDAMGGEPANLHKKELRVDYALDGKPSHAVVREHGTLRLPPAPEIGLPPQFDPTIDADGHPAVRLWGNGRIDLQMADGAKRSVSAANLPAPRELTGPWSLRFPPNWGAPPSVTLDRLASWTESADAGVRYFSGTATYEKPFTVTADQLTDGSQLWLDLGAVKNFAEVTVNGQNQPLLWKPPFRLNVTAAVKPGENQLVVRVTNLWPNRIIGDEQLPPDCEWNGQELKAWPQWLLDGKPSPTGRLTFATWHHWSKGDPLLESGLLGPVTLRCAALVPVK